MAFWIAILSGTLFVWLAIRMGFYETWILLFNVVVSIYVSIFLTPIGVEWVPAADGAASYHTALCMIVLAGGCFAVLQGLSFVFLTGQFHIPFPRVFDIFLSGVLGFVAGFLVLSFAALVLTTTPLAHHKILGVLGLGNQPRQANLISITRSCNVIHSLAGFDGSSHPAQAAVQRLLEINNARPQSGPRPPDVNEPSVPPSRNSGWRNSGDAILNSGPR